MSLIGHPFFSTMEIKRQVTTYKGLLDHYTEESIFYLIFGESPQIGKKYRSPIRNDKSAGCFFKHSKNRLFFYDYAVRLKGFSCFDLAVEIYKCDYKELISILTRELIRNNIPRIEKTVYNKQDFNIKLITQKWNENNLSYWKQFDVTLETLQDHKVLYCEEVWVKLRNDYFRRFLKDPTFAYKYSDSKLKIYSPYDTKYKHFSNVGKNAYFGNVDKNVTKTIITKSPKDVLVIKQHLGKKINVIAPMSENSYPEGFENVTLFYDNDEAGIRYSNMFSEEYDCDYYLIPKECGAKDISDLYIKDKKLAKEIINELSRKK